MPETANCTQPFIQQMQKFQVTKVRLEFRGQLPGDCLILALFRLWGGGGVAGESLSLLKTTVFK